MYDNNMVNKTEHKMYVSGDMAYIVEKAKQGLPRVSSEHEKIFNALGLPFHPLPKERTFLGHC